ncbi:hypothetical protein GA0070609_3856 [Micromonospora echinaurantiaca]|uniref:4-amino-4-deoxy-L-arabinose transferase n=1 Tax=Micromonospora echinaurantiaca TaxID=47857 RepID=A0A1C5IY96_9ACTN|nr:DUF6077 domain-containing protein [Micromonospora echinaurantiaca]SCG63288.1 hypothetical protein GA0070609_3856 [Micromonospora echinaurantiaca]
MSKVDHVAVVPPRSAAAATPAPAEPGRLRSLIAAAPAVLTDAGVLAFALWTVLYHAAFLFSLAPSVTFTIWLAGCLVLAGVAVLRAVRRRPAASPVDPATAAAPAATTGEAAGYPRRWLVVVLAAATVAAVTAGLANTTAGDGMSWWVPASAGAVAAVGGMLLIRRMWLSSPVTASVAPAPTAFQSGYALVVSLLVAISSFFIARNTPDDVYYVGKSVWIAERDIIPMNDFLFTENVAPPMGSQPPIASIEVFAGALGRVFGIHGASATWYVLLPVLAVLAILALWRLVQRWAPRRPLLAFSVAVAFLYLVAGSDAALGTFHLPRLYEGKGMFVSAVIPLMWLYLTNWFDNRSRWGLLLIVALSVTATGLTTTAAIILPMLVGAAAFAMLLVGRWKDALLAGAAAVTYPVGSVVVSQLVLDMAAATGADDAFFDAEYTYRRTLMIGVVGVICGLALWCGPLLARRRTPALLAAGGTLTLSVLLIPGVLELLSDLSGISVVLWRVPWLLALPTLVGLLCTVDIPARMPALRRVVGVGVAAAMVASFAVFATPMWSKESWVTVHDRPTWKLPQQRQGIAFWIKDLDRPDGLVLAPSVIMRTSLIVTSRVRVVLPRDFYLVEYDLNSDFAKDRLLLAKFADGTITPSEAEVAAAIDRLGVGTICVYNGNSYAREMAPRLGFEQFAERPAPGAVTCFRRG